MTLQLESSDIMRSPTIWLKAASKSWQLWLVLLVVVNVGCVAAFEFLYSGPSPGDRWPTRFNFAGMLLLFDNFCGVWWYAVLTRQLVTNAEQQLADSRRQSLIAQKPVAYVERIEDPNRVGHTEYRIRNAGGGAAINVSYVASGTLQATPEPYDRYRNKRFRAPNKNSEPGQEATLAHRRYVQHQCKAASRRIEDKSPVELLVLDPWRRLHLFGAC